MLRCQRLIRLCVLPLAMSASLAASFAGSEPATYQLTAEDRALDCRKLSGRITVRLLQLRSERLDGRGPGSAVSDAVQGVAGPAATAFWGKSTAYLTDRAAYLARDRAQIGAYNGLLATKGCATFDIEAELAKGPDAPVPRPTRKKPAQNSVRPASGTHR
jgi:hypothetical protein